METVAFTLYLFSEVHGFLADTTFFSSSPVWHPIERTSGNNVITKGQIKTGTKKNQTEAPAAKATIKEPIKARIILQEPGKR